MLSFSRRSKCYFEGDSTVPAELLTGRPSCSYDIAATVPIPNNLQRKERYLMSLAADYLCRWSVAMPKNEIFGNEEVESNAFFAAISQADIARRARKLIPANPNEDCEHQKSLEEQMKQFNMVVPVTKCTSSLLHDWSVDTIRKNYFNSQQRVCINVQYAHACAEHGRELLKLSKEEANKHGSDTKPLQSMSAVEYDADCSLDAKKVSSALLSEILTKHKQLRSANSSETVIKTIEKTEEERKKERLRTAASEQLKIAQAEANRVESNRKVCDKMISKAQKVNPLAQLQLQRAMTTGGASTTDSQLLSSEESSSDSEICGEVDQKDQNDDESSSATFSDEELLVYKKKAVPVKKQNKSPVGISILVAAVSQDADSGTSSCDEQSEVEAKQDVDVEAKQDVEVEAKQDVEVEPKQDVEVEAKQDVEVETKPAVLEHAVRQTSFEAMIRVCESTDSLASFDQKGSTFVFQWAKRAEGDSGARTKLHLFRKQTVLEKSFFGLSSTEKFLFHLIATIELICDEK